MLKKTILLFIALSIIFVSYFINLNITHAKKIKLTREEANLLVEKFKKLNPDIKIEDEIINSNLPGYDEKNYKLLVVKIKNWEIAYERANDPNLPNEKKDKANELIQKRLLDIKEFCNILSKNIQKLKEEKKLTTENEFINNKKNIQNINIPSETKESNEQIAISESLKKLTKPEQYQPKTERGLKIKQLILGK